jgi:hypothetical protein
MKQPLQKLQQDAKLILAGSANMTAGCFLQSSPLVGILRMLPMEALSMSILAKV